MAEELEGEEEKRQRGKEERGKEGKRGRIGTVEPLNDGKEG